MGLGMTFSTSVLWLWCMTYIFPNRHLIIKQCFKSNLSTKKWTIFLLDNYNFLGIEILISDWIKFIWSDLPNTRHVLQNSTRHVNSGILQYMKITVLRICLQNVPYSRLVCDNDPYNLENNQWQCWSVSLLRLPTSNDKSLQSAGS
mgnify:CR=1 FL=1